MVERHQDIVFGSGALVFPGGRVDSGDHLIAEQPDLCPDTSGLDAAAMSFRVAAIRETFEECGILLARPRGSQALVAADRLQAIEASQRAPLCQGEITFADVLMVEELVLATDLLVPFARWITPAPVPKRFDTLFFLASAPEEQVGVHDGGESVEFRLALPEPRRGGGGCREPQADVPHSTEPDEARRAPHSRGCDGGRANTIDRDRAPGAGGDGERPPNPPYSSGGRLRGRGVHDHHAADVR